MSKITVITPCYCPEDYYLSEYFKSLESQTLDRKLFDVVFVLNGPREPYEEHIKEMKEKLCPSVCFSFYYVTTSGIAPAINFGIDVATGDYITFIDCDDYVSPRYLESLYNHRNNCQVTTANGVIFIDKTSHFLHSSLEDIFNAHKEGDYINNLHERRKVLNSAARKLFPKSVIGNKRFRSVYGFDSLFSFEVVTKRTPIVTTSKDAIYYCRCRFTSESRSKRSHRYLIKNLVTNLKYTSKVYFANPKEYSFKHYILHTAALVKSTVLGLLK